MGFSRGVRHGVQDVAAACLANPTQPNLFCLGCPSHLQLQTPEQPWEPIHMVFPARQEALQSS